MAKVILEIRNSEYGSGDALYECVGGGEMLD